MSPKILSIITSKNISTVPSGITVARSTETSSIPSVAKVCPKPQRRVSSSTSNSCTKLAQSPSKPPKQPSRPSKAAKPQQVSLDSELKPEQVTVELAQVKKTVRLVENIRPAPDFIFQAIGKLDTQVVIRDRTFVSIAGKEFRLLFNRFKKDKTFTKFQSILTEKGHDLSMIVYPQFWYGFDDRGKEKLDPAFTFVREYDSSNESQNINRAVSDLEPGRFILSGLWQTNRIGANFIQILRNDNAYQHKKRIGKKNWSTVPVVWADCPIVKSKNQSFVTIEAEFDPGSNQFIFVQLLCPPSKNIPCHQKINRLSLRKKDRPQPILRSARFKKDLVKPILVKSPNSISEHRQLGLNFELEPLLPVEKYPESELKVLMGYARSSPVPQIKNIQEATPVALLDRQGNNIGTFAFRREGRTKYWEKLAS